MKIAQKTGRVFLNVIVLIIVAWSLFYIIGRLVTPTKYPMLFGYSEAGIKTGSMEPTLSVGDHVVFHKQDSYELNDVVVFYDEIDGVFVVHRIVGKNGDKFIVQGDFNPISDTNPVKLENIQGKVIYSIPNLQTFLLIGYGTLATILIQWVFKPMQKKIPEEGGNANEEQNIQTI